MLMLSIMPKTATALQLNHVAEVKSIKTLFSPRLMMGALFIGIT